MIIIKAKFKNKCLQNFKFCIIILLYDLVWVRRVIRLKNVSLLEKIETDYKSFSKGKKKIANFIKENYDKAAYITAAKLGNIVGVSESTVVRFASELGFDGYPAMQKEIKALARTKLTSAQRIEVTAGMYEKDDIVNAVLESDMENIKATLQDIDKDEFKAITDAITVAKNVYIVGVRSSATLAAFFSFHLNFIRSNVRLVQSSTASELFEQIFRIGEGDVLIGMSFPRYSKRTLKAVNYAKSRNATVVCITDSKTAPAAQAADFSLVAKSDMISVVDSLVAPMSVINALLAAVCMNNEDEVLSAFKRLEGIWDENEVYETSEPERQG